MHQQLLLLIIFLNCLLIKSEKMTYSSVKINLVFYYSHGKGSTPRVIPITAHLVPKFDAVSAYILMGEEINDNTLSIKAFNCINMKCSCGSCERTFQSKFIFIYF
jgi:hypothetical protein